MIKNKKISLSILNSVLLIIFLLIVTVAILISTYLNTQKVVDKNIDDYFSQTHNLASLVLASEQNFLESISNEIGSKIYEESKTGEFNSLENIENSNSLDDIDIMFLKINDKIIDFSNSLFDTSLIISQIQYENLGVSKSILNVNIENENYILMLNSKKIINKETGRVNAIFYAGKIFNDNFTLLNNIKQKAKLNDIYLFFNKKLIATTNTKEKIDFSMFDMQSTISQDKLIYTIRLIGIIDDKLLDFVFVSSNSTFDLLKESYIKQSLLLLVFVLISFLILYFLSNKYIIRPFSVLLDYAHKAKDNENPQYKDTNVYEFDKFAYELKGIIEELKELKEQYARAIDGVQDGLWDVDIKNKKAFFSSQFMRMLGYENEDEISYRSFWQRNIHKEEYENTIDKLRAHINGETSIFESEYRFKCKDGSYKWIKIRGKIFFDENGKRIRMTGFHTDIDNLIKLENENKQKEQMLYQQSKLASMGEMIGNIAHQWRQPLTVISVVASTISMQIELGTLDKESSRNDFKKLHDTVQYLSSIIDKFRHYFDPENKEEYFNIKEAVNDNMEIFESSYKSNNINMILDLEDIEIYGYKFELMQVIVNILSNAKDALINKQNEEESEKFIFMKTQIQNDNLDIIIYDNAGGIPDDVREKIYEPYFTTKHQSQGTGLGLYMSSQIVKNHFVGNLTNKTIEFEYESKSYKGEEFTITIPSSRI